MVDLNATSIRSHIREFMWRNMLNTHGNPQEHGMKKRKNKFKETTLMKNTFPQIDETESLVEIEI